MLTRGISVAIAAALLWTNLACSGAALAQVQASAAQRNRVIIQVSDADPGKWNLALNNAKNLQADLGASNVDIEIVAYGPGLGMLKIDSVVAQRVDEATKAGVIVATSNANPFAIVGDSFQTASIILGTIAFFAAIYITYRRGALLAERVTAEAIALTIEVQEELVNRAAEAQRLRQRPRRARTL